MFGSSHERWRRFAPAGLPARSLLFSISESVGARLIDMTEATCIDAARRSPRRVQCFRDNALLAGISDEIYAELEDKIHVVEYRPNQIIFEENEAGNSLFLIAQGSVKISKKGRAGQQETLAYLMEKDFFGEMALVDVGRRSAQAVAVEDVIAGRIDRDGWDLLLQRAPHQVLGNFTRSVTRRLRHNNQHFIEEVMRSERLALIGSTISSIVHDMNNPISCILCACEIIQRSNPDGLVGEASELIRVAVRNMENMTRELIDFSRGHTQLDRQSVKVADLIRAIEADFAPYRPQVELATEVFYSGTVQADRNRLLRVFSNLIRNACEAMAQTEETVLHLSVTHVDDCLRFQFSDTGCGIPAHLLPGIFEPFVTHGKSNGTGLGLAISKAVVEAHGGSISVQTGEAGTTFTVDLPTPEPSLLRAAWPCVPATTAKVVALGPVEAAG
jgi:signal transduction histidine kinase